MDVAMFIQKGGFMMYPLVLCSVILMTVFFERFWYFISHRFSKEAYASVKNSIEQGHADKALERLSSGRSALENVFREVIENRSCSRHELEHVVTNKGIEELQKYARNLHVIELIGRISPMLGLAGTVIGMALSFRTISTVSGTVDPSLLAGGIWEALLTTIAGLLVGIPALIIYHFFEKKLHLMTVELKIKGEEIVRLMEQCHDRL